MSNPESGFPAHPTTNAAKLTPEAIERAIRSINALGRASEPSPEALEVLRALGIEHPAEARTRLTAEITGLGLTANVKELDDLGYTVVRDAFDADVAARIRTRILELAAEDRAAGLTTYRRGLAALSPEKDPLGQKVFRLLERGRVFEEIALHPVLASLVASLLGPGYTVSIFVGSICPKGSPALGLHADNQWMPDPFPPWHQVTTAIWCLDDFSAAGGATRLVPRSNKLGRHPQPGEGEDEAIAVEAPKGSLIMWVGNTWHGNCERVLSGERVALHTTFCRMHLRPIESYDRLSQEIVDRNPPAFAQLIGRNLPWGDHGTSGPDFVNSLRAKLMAHA